MHALVLFSFNKYYHDISVTGSRSRQTSGHDHTHPYGHPLPIGRDLSFTRKRPGLLVSENTCVYVLPLSLIRYTYVLHW